MPMRDVRALAAALAGIAAATLVYAGWLGLTNATTVALTYLLIVLVTAATARLVVAVIASLAAMLCFNYFFLPPVGNWTIADPQNWVALFAFLAVSLVASRLSDAARSRTREATARRDELARLFDLSRDVLMLSAGPEALPTLARTIARRFDLEVAAIALPEGSGWQVVQGGAEPAALEPAQLTAAFRAAGSSIEFDARERAYAGHQVVAAGGRPVRVVPLRSGTRAIGLLAAAGRAIEAGTLDALGGVVAIGIERTQFLEERSRAALTRHSEELKTALLASLGHDLRTPLTSIRVAAANLGDAWLTDAGRAEQSGIILQEVERLTRLFHNVLEMARIDAGAIEKSPRWTQPSEIVAAAREQVEHALKGHRVVASATADQPVQVDARLIAAALAYLLENAAHYAPPGTPIEIASEVSDADLIIRVRDHGPGIAAADLPHLFARFYRGAAARARASGSGMGLWIARELLGAQQGRVWAENCADGGARFTIAVPVLARHAAPADEVASS